MSLILNYVSLNYKDENFNNIKENVPPYLWDRFSRDVCQLGLWRYLNIQIDKSFRDQVMELDYSRKILKDAFFSMIKHLHVCKECDVKTKIIVKNDDAGNNTVDVIYTMEIEATFERLLIEKAICTKDNNEKGDLVSIFLTYKGELKPKSKIRNFEYESNFIDELFYMSADEIVSFLDVIREHLKDLDKIMQNDHIDIVGNNGKKTVDYKWFQNELPEDVVTFIKIRI